MMFVLKWPLRIMAILKMETKANYTLVGIFVIVLLIITIVMGLWVSTGLENIHYKTYLVYTNESVTGLSTNAPVKYNGVTVGFVSEIELNLKNPQQVILTLQIKPEVPITETTRAILMEQGITGIAYIGLRTGEPAPLLKARKNQPYPVIATTPSFLGRLDSTIENLSGNLSDMSRRVKMLLSKKNIQLLQDSLMNIKQISGNLANNSDNISSSLNHFNIFMKNSAHASQSFPELLKAIKETSASIQQLSTDLQRTSHTINQTAEQSSVAVQSFSNSLLPETYQTMHHINKLSKHLSQLTQELEENPSMILKGKTTAKPGPGER